MRRPAEPAHVVPVGTHALAWAAGFFDGEGYVGVRETGRSYRKNPNVIASANQCDPEPLERFQAAVGFGRIYGPRQRGKQHWRPVYEWQTGARTLVHQLCWLLWPWLGEVKRRQFHEAFERYHVLQAKYEATR